VTEDLVSETFLAAIRTIGKFDPKRGTVYGWLLGIAGNKLQDHFRNANRTVDGQPIQADEVADADSVDPDRRLIAAEVKHAVARTLDAMEDAERLALEWKYMESLSVREIAQRLDRTEKAAEAVLYRARASFRAIHARELTRTE
jgi:RNA polymerase sigma-70 factor (ECF subfamily)